MIRRPPRSTPLYSSAASDVYKRQGVEHAVLHLLYSRFWHKVLFDLGHVSSEEPFRKLFNQGYIQAFAFRDSRGQSVPAAEVIEVKGPDGEIAYAWHGEPVTREYGKMGK